MEQFDVLGRCFGPAPQFHLICGVPDIIAAPRRVTGIRFWPRRRTEPCSTYTA
ncbi:hypothetical protein [Dankookia rubra]|uniref:hypothetical protein n=1 Tax=Dankookia rubra TaxID=1442381 RepID=UPI00140C664B|nr:hypothetical protein [Dankookia rubra]